MEPAQISKKVNREATAEAKREKKLVMLEGITCVAQLKIKKLTSREIVEITKGDGRNPRVLTNYSKITQCPFSTCEFQGNWNQLILHKLKLHRTITPYKCNQPGCKYESNKRESLARHTLNFHDPHHHCTYDGCDFTARSKTQFNIHLVKMHNKKPYVCETCQKGFKTAYQLGHHMKEHFKKKIPCTFPNCNYEYFPHLTHRIKDHMMTHTGEKPHKCPHCSWRTRDISHLKVHMQLHQSKEARAKLRIFKCTWENCNFSSNKNSSLKQHLNTHLEIKPFKCTFPKCAYTARDNAVIKVHMRTHSSEKLKSYMCTFCNVSCSTRDRLVIHVRRHTGEKPFKCPYPNCEYSTAEPGVINSHIKVRHNEEIRERNFTCAFCPKSYLFKKSLEDHMRSHTGERPYNCQYCRRAFYYNSAKYSHEKICKMCPVDKLNRPFSCQFCEKAFVFKARKNNHEMCCKMRADGNVIKPHKCQYCAKSFIQKTSLKHHEKYCSSRPDEVIIKPFKCSFSNCNFETVWRVNLERHKKCVH